MVIQRVQQLVLHLQLPTIIIIIKTKGFILQADVILAIFFLSCLCPLIFLISKDLNYFAFFIVTSKA